MLLPPPPRRLPARHPPQTSGVRGVVGRGTALALVLCALALVAPGGATAAPRGVGSPAAAPASSAAAGAAPAGRPSPASRWSWPLAGEPRVERPFVAPAQRWSPGHRGVDLAAVAGGQVLAPAAGRVTFAGRVVDRGVVVVEHEDGLRSSLEPVEDPPPVGTSVARGDAVGRVGAEGAHCPGCLHWGVRRGTGRDAVYLDPLSLLRPAAPPVLLPLPPGGSPGAPSR
ncbi:peptidoglycan DD-metalloendopeptidase family protein [Pseudokineococcus sp. 1T1Z-3]|uniref:peptidoglycan DD-metalloendopeptidase family protein n=1 Tax=Pseudokineococcus sp. 1T1Z-3 TaxID=3132745 RepID=UPI0030B13497